MQRLIVTLFVSACCTSIVQGEVRAESQDTPLTVEQALQLAGTASPTLEAAAAGIRSASASRTVAGMRPNPEFSLSVENVAGRGIYRDMRSAETTAQVTLPLELGDKRSARVAVAGAQGTRARIAAAIAEADLRFAVIHDYISAIAAERRLRTAEASSRLAAQELNHAIRQLSAGRTGPLHSERAGLAHKLTKAAVDRDRRLLEIRRANLARQMGRTTVGVLDDSWFDRIDTARPARPVDITATLAMAVAEADLRVAGTQVRLARAQRVEDVTMSAGARRLSASRDTVALLGIAIPLQLFNGGRSALAQATADRDQYAALRDAAERETALRLSLADAEVATTADAALMATGPAVAVALEAARLGEVAGRETKHQSSAMFDAERELTDAQSAATEALVAYHGAVARRDRLAATAPVDSWQ